MTVGDGILWSTVLLLLAVAAYQVSVRNKWKAAGKMVGVLLLVVVVVVGGSWGWNRYKDRPREVTELAGVRLGMSSVEVKLAKGAPQNEAEAKTEREGDEYSLLWYFKDGDYSPVVQVRFYGKTEDTLKASVVCDTGASRLFGLATYSSERQVVEKLGPPTKTSIAENGLSKVVSFKPYKVAFAVEKGTVTEVCISQSGTVAYAREYKASPSQDQKR